MYIFVVVWSVCIFVAALASLAHLSVIAAEDTTTLEAARNVFTVAAGFIAFPMALYGMHMKREDLQIKREEAEKTSDEEDIGETASEGGPRYEIYQDRAGEWRWRLVAPNGKIIDASAESYSTKDGCRRGIELVRTSINAPILEV